MEDITNGTMCNYFPGKSKETAQASWSLGSLMADKIKLTRLEYIREHESDPEFNEDQDWELTVLKHAESSVRSSLILLSGFMYDLWKK